MCCIEFDSENLKSKQTSGRKSSLKLNEPLGWHICTNDIWIGIVYVYFYDLLQLPRDIIYCDLQFQWLFFWTMYIEREDDRKPSGNLRFLHVFLRQVLNNGICSVVVLGSYSLEVLSNIPPFYWLNYNEKHANNNKYNTESNCV